MPYKRQLQWEEERTDRVWAQLGATRFCSWAQQRRYKWELLVCFVIVVLFAGSMLHYSIRLIVSGLFIAAMLASIVSLAPFPSRGLLRN
jgi:hypothetical protein